MCRQRLPCGTGLPSSAIQSPSPSWRRTSRRTRSLQLMRARHQALPLQTRLPHPCPRKKRKGTALCALSSTATLVPSGVRSQRRWPSDTDTRTATESWRAVTRLCSTMSSRRTRPFRRSEAWLGVIQGNWFCRRQTTLESSWWTTRPAGDQLVGSMMNRWCSTLRRRSLLGTMRPAPSLRPFTFTALGACRRTSPSPPGSTAPRQTTGM
mmetsp:Transcript_12965/g.37709  ORF Transcript_12965/g.37709 Transcript_12965/m.37709 type:complete len:209 (-) Transcript_12965:1129-1755(-)